MKKHLLFAAMLMLSAAPAVAASAASAPYFAADEAPATLATEDEYNALVKVIEDFTAELKADLAKLDEQYPLDETAHSVVNGTLTGEGGLTDMLAEVKAKYEAGTLTADEVTTYQTTLSQWKETFTWKAIEEIALPEHLSGLVYQYADEANEKISEAEAEIPENVYDYYSSAMDAIGGEISQKQYSANVSTIEQADELKTQFGAIAAKALALLPAAKAASPLLDDITTALKAWNEQMEKGLVDFPDYDWASAKEYQIDYWAAIKNTLSDFIADEAEPYTEKDIAGFVEDFSYVKDIDLYATAQAEGWQDEYNAKYYPVSQKISNAYSTLDEECPHVASTYMEKLDDFNAEMTQALMSLSEGTVSKEEFDKMLARVDEISTEVDKVVADAKAAEATATGINGVTVEAAAKAGKAYTIDGKRVNTVTNGLYIINGKKVVVKK